MVQQILRLFDTSLIEELHEKLHEEHATKRTEEQHTAGQTLLEETQQLFHSDGSEAELVALIQKAIDAIHELCD
ncbi:hypothetical protein [Leptolyngbya sp. FACHB-711]|jgi:hypothetical protein|uniref:hypothetical protein n=1 Tax=unclassified Leptolyngbya TaxID=2650499 RepID=UPI001686B2AC|nr:hypothetical protein [Leptolyngbya sp. FACHB-711]MBD1850874.1 hypothetical protein [Cyanobacteria bacterium FACHB-502]MBD2024002.1 hypothetical protein [Leptolyngbya sp. FACHB-711]